MEDKLNILLVEDDLLDCKKMTIAIEKEFEHFNLIGITNSAFSAINKIKEFHPDIIILDLELSLGQGTGFDVLKELKKDNLSYSPYVVVTTNNISNVTHSIAREYGGDFIFTKTQKGYTATQVIDFLLSAKKSIIGRKKTFNTDYNNMLLQSKEYYLLELINRYLLDLGVSPKHKGFDYLKMAILLTIQEPNKSFIHIIAAKNKKSPASIERAMQNAINRTWSVENIEDLYTKYKARISSAKGVPTINEFVYYYVSLVKIESRLFYKPTLEDFSQQN